MPLGGLEIPIHLKVFRGNSSEQIFERKKSFVTIKYLEPNDIHSEIDNLEVMDVPL